ncbi:Reticulon protein [Paragonimus heterotremus]|uniref:Reticulon-like protein n=1 Tax=Paragonimus heterotremus TaxID=100268 RepID=A0A8J4TB01_9TREM|nr:Reticulon protein [Paragonimus heterotremus]
MKSGIFVVLVLTALFSLSCLSLVSVLAYAGLSLLCCTTAARLYQYLLKPTKNVAASNVKETNATSDDLFGKWFTKDIKLSSDWMSKRAVSLSSALEPYLIQLQSVLLLKSYAETCKFLVLLYSLSVLGSCFNLLTLVIIGFILLFTLPTIYRLYQKPLDGVYEKLRKHLSVVNKKIQTVLEKITGAKKSA